MSDGKAKAVRDFEATVTALEKRRKSKIFIIVHTTSPHHLCNPELWTTIENRNQFKGTDTIEILVHSPGGHANIAYKIARFLRGRSTRLNALVPLQAKSATTLLCLGADSIVMGELAELGPLDVQLGDELEKGKAYFSPLNEFKSMEYLRDYATEFLDFFSFLLFNRGMSIKQALHEAIPAVTGIMGPLYSHVDPSKLGSYKRALSEGEEYAKRLLGAVGNPRAKEIVSELVWNYPVHDFVIDREEAKQLGLPIQKMEPNEETLLLKVVTGLMEHELPYIGFIPKRNEQKQKGKSKVEEPAELPSPTQRTVGASAH